MEKLPEVKIDILPPPVTYFEEFSSPNTIIGISGIIGAGKTTLVDQLSEKLGFMALKEPVKENPYLPLFYKDMDKWGFSMQIFLLTARFRQHQSMIWSGKNCIQDRTIYEDVIFAKMLYESGKILPIDFNTYKICFDTMCNFLHRPDLIIYLNVEPEVALQRIRTRGRACEAGITVEYLKDLKKGYDDWKNDGLAKRIPVIDLDWNQFKSVDYVIERIKEESKRKIMI